MGSKKKSAIILFMVQKSCQPVEGTVVYPHYLQGFIYARWLAFGFLNHQQSLTPRPSQRTSCAIQIGSLKHRLTIRSLNGFRRCHSVGGRFWRWGGRSRSPYSRRRVLMLTNARLLVGGFNPFEKY